MRTPARKYRIQHFEMIIHLYVICNKSIVDVFNPANIAKIFEIILKLLQKSPMFDNFGLILHTDLHHLHLLSTLYLLNIRAIATRISQFHSLVQLDQIPQRLLIFYGFLVRHGFLIHSPQ
jgi:hypothetical protein